MTINITSEQQFQKIINEDQAIILFSASWCPSCKVFQPIFNEYSENNNIKFYYFDTDLLNELARKENILSIPTMRFYQKSKIIKQLKDFSSEGLKEFVKN